MKMLFTLPAIMAVAAISDFAQGQVVGDRASVPPAINVQTPAATVDLQPRQAPAAIDATRLPPRADVVRADATLFTDNRPDQWRYKWENNRWWYWTPENRWMSYSEPSGWTYYEPSGSYTAGYGGVGVTATPAPAGTYYPTYGYYGYPYNNYGGGYYGRPGVYINGGWGGVGIGYGGGRGRWR